METIALFQNNIAPDALRVCEIQGNKLTADAIRRQLQSPHFQPGRDAVVLVYSGLAAHHPELCQLLTPADCPKLYRDDVRNALEAANPRLAVLITDCCNTLIPTGRTSRWVLIPITTSSWARRPVSRLSRWRCRWNTFAATQTATVQ